MNAGQQKIVKFNLFRKLCLKNAEQMLASAELLMGKNVNHVVFHLLVLSLEEVGKTFVAWLKINEKDEWGKETFSINIEDHVKKLFWVIWWPTLLKTQISNKDLDEVRNLASRIHNKRLDSLYTQLPDTVDGSKKVTDKEIEFYTALAKDRLTYAHTYGEPSETSNDRKDADLAWLDRLFDDPSKHGSIFNEESIAKFNELGNSHAWIEWLRAKFGAENQRLQELLKQEMAKSKTLESQPLLKWKIRFTLITPSHSVRNNILQQFSAKNNMFKLSKGKDVHTLIVDMFLTTNTPVETLWHSAWLNAQLFVAGLNVGTNGIFYWHVPLDTDKFYNAIWDLENKTQVLALANPDLKFNWSEKKMYLDELQLRLAIKAFYYFASCLNSKDLFESINLYMIGLGQAAKIDVHLRLERQSFFSFFLAFRKALITNQKCKEDFDMKDIAFKQLGGLFKNRIEFDRGIDLGLQLLNDFNASANITLTEVMAMKLNCNYYFMTLAQRTIENRDDIFLVVTD